MASPLFPVFEAYLQANNVQLSRDEIDRLAQIVVERKVYRKQYLLQEGNVWRTDAFVARGCVRTYRRMDDGQEHILAFAIENWWTGDRESLLSGSPSRLNIDAIEDSVILLFPHDRFEGLCQTIPPFGVFIQTILQRSFVRSQKRIETELSSTAEQKYADFVERYPQFLARVPQAMIASYLGMTPETLSRVRRQATKK